ncbi:MAG: CehA/McbA family metallohydrolase [Acidobacteria bacterium]|nr:CehA/McbA family metallohydrolase [Acidobacteriota bacterium]
MFDPAVDGRGRWKQMQIDMGQIISAQPRKDYPNGAWDGSYNNQVPEIRPNEVVVEYCAHPDARFHFESGDWPMTPIPPATQRVRIRVREKSSGKLTPVKLHLHGESGEYLAPADRHRQPNPAWFEDYAPEFQHQGRHYCTYIPGETVVDLPLGSVYLEVSKGFEIRPIRKTVRIERSTEILDVEIEKLLPWRERGWVTADTHVHFLSPATAQLEGAGEGVNVDNLLASQWGELMTNAGDFDGRTTFGAREAGGDGEYLVRVGTENRQHVLGHISLLGYKGNIISPMCAGGPDEAALGDSIGVLLMEWAEQCKAQGGLVVLPHYPNPRCENAADLVSGVIDAVEMTSWGSLYGGIDPYSLSDWYRYLNCGHFIAAVGGTDKMTATTAVGTVRTYARIPDGREFTYDEWMQAVRAGHTFVTYGPLVEFSVGGRAPGTGMKLTSGGGTLDVAWDAASVTVPMSKVELVVNGEVRESRSVRPDKDAGHWSVRVERSSWIALLVRGHYADKPEIIAAHTSPVMIEVDNSPFFSAADAVTILDQIEGALAYLDTVGTRAEDAVYKRLRLKLTAAHRTLHNQLHQRGQYHEHTPVTQHS